MRRVGAVVAVIGVGGLIAFGACGGDETEEGPKSCAGLLEPHPCFQCIEVACCDPLAACLKDSAPGGCTDCLAGDQTACKTPLWTALFQCGDQQCHDQCVDLKARYADCSPPSVAPSMGSCVTLGGSYECNPITNEGCDEAGASCDLDPSTNVVHCFPPPNELAVCETCGADEGFCAPGHTCIQTLGLEESGVIMVSDCARVCCDDGDCGPEGKCETSNILGMTVGACVKKETGAGGTAGAGGSGGGGAGEGGSGG